MFSHSHYVPILPAGNQYILIRFPGITKNRKTLIVLRG